MNDKTANKKMELGLARSGYVFFTLFFVGLLLARFIAPLRPDASAGEIARIYQENADPIRLGLIFVFLGSIFYLVFASSVTAQTARIRSAPKGLIFAQLTSIGAAAVILILPVVIWWIAAFRPDTRPADSTQLLNDLGWMLWVIGFTPWTTWMATIGLTILSDTDDDPLFPRWSGYFSIFVALAQLAPVVAPFFKTGPLAWNGVIAYWAPLSIVFVWVVVFVTMTSRATVRSLPAADASTDLVSGRAR
jgi:hypothetical protein